MMDPDKCKVNKDIIETYPRFWEGASMSILIYVRFIVVINRLWTSSGFVTITR